MDQEVQGIQQRNGPLCLQDTDRLQDGGGRRTAIRPLQEGARGKMEQHRGIQEAGGGTQADATANQAGYFLPRKAVGGGNG